MLRAVLVLCIFALFLHEVVHCQENETGSANTLVWRVLRKCNVAVSRLLSRIMQSSIRCCIAIPILSLQAIVGFYNPSCNLVHGWADMQNRSWTQQCPTAGVRPVTPVNRYTAVICSKCLPRWVPVPVQEWALELQRKRSAIFWRHLKGAEQRWFYIII